ncbi:MAG: glycosyltransferase family 2 protein [Candidatus Nanopelagicaceae bacterium]
MPNQTLELLMMMTSSEPLLTIGYSTLAQRAKNIRFPKEKSDREVIVIVQSANEAEISLEIDEEQLIRLKSRGVAKSRNAALRSASGKYLLFGDDDVTFNEAGIDEVLAYFEAHSECSVIMAQAVDESGALRKNYPTKPHKLTRFNSAKAATYEMMVRVDAIRAKGIKFDENFGAGAENYLGDEYIFISDALKAGLKGVFLPVPVAVHPKDSSGSDWGTRKDLTARAAVFSRVFGPTAPLIRALFLVKSRKGKVGFINAARFIIGR